jgi:MFS family permease
MRWFILFFSCLMMVGNYYCYDIPAALHSQMNEYMGKPDDFETMFSLLYTVYSIPNVILPFFGGYFVDKLGVRLCLLVFASLITAGQLVFAFGLSIKSWPVMLIGRVLYGFGGESFGVGNSAVLSIWFKGKELAFAFGLNLSIARLGSVINNQVSPAIASGVDIQFALWFGVILCGTSILSVLAIAAIDKQVEATLKEGQSFRGLLNDDEDVEVDLKNGNANASLLDNGEPAQAPRTVSTTSDVQEVLAENKSEISFRDMFSFKQVFWILAIICVVVYGE